MTATRRIRGLADKVGFAHRASQMDEVMRRIGEACPPGSADAGPPWRVAIAPHDDYTYAGCLYPPALSRVKAHTVIIFGVAHKARTLGLENRVIFDSFTHWHGPYGDIPVSPLRDELVNAMKGPLALVHDEMQSVEHSVEAKLPFLQHYNRGVQIVSILVPAMSHARMREIAAPLARAIARATRARGWAWGRDFAIVISTDAVHYGDEGWGGRNFARYGVGDDGYRQGVEHDLGIIRQCLEGDLQPAKTQLFTRHTVSDDDYREYKWTWCGRYSVPFGLQCGYELQQALGAAPLSGQTLGYATSIDAPRIHVEDLQGMGVTAPANLRHWVGYTSVGYP
jgi:AmmeMemoRadiSam system protein B